MVVVNPAAAEFDPRKILNAPEFKILSEDDMVSLQPDDNLACCYAPSAKLHLVKKPTPKPGPGQVLIKVRATG